MWKPSQSNTEIVQIKQNQSLDLNLTENVWL